MSWFDAFSPPSLGNERPRPPIRFGAHPNSVVQPNNDLNWPRAERKGQQSQRLSQHSDYKEQTASDSSSTSQSASNVDVFGPTHPLHRLVAAHLPDVLARIVLAYQSPLLPRQHHYHGHIVLPYGAYGFCDPRQKSMSSTSLPSLAHRSFSWSGWMNRSPASTRYRNYFLLSFHSHHKPGPSQWLHIGYRQHYVQRKKPQENRAFTFGFNGNDLDARAADTDLMLFGAWEHWSGSYDYPRQQTTPPIPNMNESFTCDAAHHPPVGTLLGRRKLYRNGQLVVEDDCIPLTADQHSTLVVGNYQHHGHDMTLDGGVCDVRLYSRVLSAAEMRALYSGEEQEVSGECLEAHWPLEGGQHIQQLNIAERMMVDVSGHGRHLEVRTLRSGEAVPSRYQVDGQL